MRLLRKKGDEVAELWRPNAWGETPLHIAASHGSTAIVKYIINHASIGTWAAHSAQEITADGKLGGVQLWKSAHTSCAMPKAG